MSRATVPDYPGRADASDRGRTRSRMYCPGCTVGILRMESDQTGQTFEECDRCGYRSRFRSEAHQARLASQMAAEPRQGRRMRRARRS